MSVGGARCGRFRRTSLGKGDWVRLQVMATPPSDCYLGKLFRCLDLPGNCPIGLVVFVAACQRWSAFGVDWEMSGI